MSASAQGNGEGRPVLAFALGDAAGIGAELAAKVLLDDEVRAAARLCVIGDLRQLERGGREAGIDLAALGLTPVAKAEAGADVFVDLANIDFSAVIPGQASRASGAAALQNFAFALSLCDAGGADAACFTPFNKHAMRLARPDYVDEIGFIRRVIGSERDGSEFNVLDEIWNARVTSHIPLGAVAGRITEERVLASIELTDATMRAAGKERPRIAVAALNPHAGDGGNFGSEDEEIIAPAVERARQRQLSVAGPIPSDTVYLRAVGGEFDAVVSMYHDQGQIAMKLIGFDRGVTLIGGYPFWIATPAHGTAYDIAGKGIANPNATKRAIMLAAAMAARSQRHATDPGRQLSIAAELIAASTSNSATAATPSPQTGRSRP